MHELFDKLKRFNFWDGNVPKLGFERTDYLQKVDGFVNNQLIKVIVGQRRTGKSYMLRQIANRLLKNGTHPRNIFYINKEYLAFDFIKNYKDLDTLIQVYQEKMQPEGRFYLFIDEVQNVVGWEKLVNSYAQDFSNTCEIFISGSNSKMLSGELATLLSGRYISFEIFPFSYQEYIDFYGLEPSKPTYLTYLQTGGLPELFALPNEETKRQYVSSVKDTVLLRDIIQKNAIKDPKLLEDVFVYLVNNASNLLSVNNITNYMKSKGRKTSFDTISNYVGFIEDTFLVHKAHRYDIKEKDTVAGNAKYYANDLAYKNYLYSGFGYGMGYLLENLVYLCLCRADFEVYVGVLPDKEIDFVAKKADTVLYVQCAYSLQEESTLEREFSALEAVPDHYTKLVVSMDDFILPSRNGILHTQAWQLEAFLKQILP
ncbi:MAG: ATP-binding protein [Bacteroidetes bacterium]|nr:MAG: ATP-binding protein [Bacteroidota bacterium]TAF89717.1 MAG: ATP-binding protein [Bacteroidota bacterium]